MESLELEHPHSATFRGVRLDITAPTLAYPI
jgi:hypothetical protein